MDIRSTPDNIIDHWHRLVDCQEKVLSPSWAVVKLVEQPYGWVTFCSLGVVKTLERERAREVGERAIVRKEEHGVSVRGERHRELEVRDRAEERCREVSGYTSFTFLLTSLFTHLSHVLHLSHLSHL